MFNLRNTWTTTKMSPFTKVGHQLSPICSTLGTDVTSWWNKPMFQYVPVKKQSNISLFDNGPDFDYTDVATYLAWYIVEKNVSGTLIVSVHVENEVTTNMQFDFRSSLLCVKMYGDKIWTDWISQVYWKWILNKWQEFDQTFNTSNFPYYLWLIIIDFQMGKCHFQSGKLTV